MDQVRAEQLEQNTSSLLSGTGAITAFLLLAICASDMPALYLDCDDTVGMRVIYSGHASTYLLSTVTDRDIDTHLAASLASVFANISRNQRELDRDAKRVLYGRMRDFYRR